MHRLLVLLPLLLLTVAAIRHTTAVLSDPDAQCRRQRDLPRAFRQFQSAPLVTYQCDSLAQVRHLMSANHSADAEAVVLRHASLERMPLWSSSAVPSAPLRSPPPPEAPLAPSVAGPPTASGLRAARPSALTLAPNPVTPPRRLLYFDISNNALEALNFSHQATEVRRSLEYLDASWNRLDTLLVLDFAGMANLKSLVLHHNSLDLPDVAVFRGAPDLVRLDLSHNPLRLLRAAWFQGLYQLQHVDLSNTQLKRIAREAFLSNRLLNHLDLADNLLVAMAADALNGLESLAWLSLGGNRLEEVPTKALRALPALELLTLDGNRFTELSEGDLSAMNLSYVSLNRLSHLTLVQASAFLDLPRLQVVQMSDNERLRHIHPHAFTNVPQLRELYLQSNKLRFLPQELVQGRTANVSVYNNPFYCDCNIKWIVNALTKADSATPRTHSASAVANVVSAVESSTAASNSASAAAATTPVVSTTTTSSSSSVAMTSSAPPMTTSRPPSVHFLESYKYECKMPDSALIFLLSHVPPRLLRDRCEPRLYSNWIERRIVRDAGSSLRLLCWGSGLPRPRITWQLPGGRRMYAVSRRRRRRRNGRKRARSVKGGKSGAGGMDNNDSVLEEDEDIRGARITVDSGGLTLRDLRISDGGEYRCRGRARGHLVVLRFIVSVHDSRFKLTLLGATHNSIAVTWGGHPRRLQHLYKLGVRAYSTHHLNELQQLVILEPRMRSHTFAHLQAGSRYEICLQPLTSRSLRNKMHCLMADTADAPAPVERTGIREIMRRSTVFLILGLVGSTAITICLIALFYKQLYRRYQSRKYYQRPVRSMRQELMVPLQTYNHSGSSEVIFDSRTSLITNEVKEF